MSFWKHLRAVLLLPVMVALVVPYLLSMLPTNGLFGIEEPSIELWLLSRLMGFIAIYLGVVLLFSTIWMFARHGQGTLAPWDPTGKLVVRGMYRRVRNPMITGVCLLLIGESLFTGSIYMLAWALFFLAVNAIYIPLSEEPGLEKRFGDDYREYKRNVPRWLPRSKPWEPQEATME